MADPITLDEVKNYLRVDQDAEDGLIAFLLDAATDAAADYINLTPAELAPAMPAPVKAAILLQVADLYENRERQGSEAYYQNRTYERLLNPYRVMAV